MSSRHTFQSMSAGVSILRMIVFGAVFLPVAANANPNLDLLHLQVFAKQSIRAARSDYQGPTAAGSGIELSDFEIAGDLSSGGHISFSRGSVKGLVSSPVKTLTQVFSSGPGSFDRLAFDLASVKLDLLSSRLSSLQTTTTAQIVSVGKQGSKVTNIVIDATHDLDVVDLTADQLISDATDHRNIELKGDRRSRLVIRVSGTNVHFRDLGVMVAGDLSPSRVAFYFPEAKDLEVASAGGAIGPDGRSWGIPGSIVAPNAVLRFSSALVTGQVFVKEIALDGDLVSGQIDRMPSASPERPGANSGNDFTPSEVLSLMDDSAFVARAPNEAEPVVPGLATRIREGSERLRCSPRACSSCGQPD